MQNFKNSSCFQINEERFCEALYSVRLARSSNSRRNFVLAHLQKWREQKRGKTEEKRGNFIVDWVFGPHWGFCGRARRRGCSLESKMFENWNWPSIAVCWLVFCLNIFWKQQLHRVLIKLLCRTTSLKLWWITITFSWWFIKQLPFHFSMHRLCHCLPSRVDLHPDVPIYFLFLIVCFLLR